MSKNKSSYKRLVYSTVVLILVLFKVNGLASQESKPFQVEAGIQGSVIPDDPSWGGGVHGKVLFPLRNGNFIMGGIIYDHLTVKYKITGNRYIYDFINANAGYRMIFKSWFFEPGIGGGYYVENDPWDDLKGLNFCFNIEGGVLLDRFTLTAAYRLISTEGLLWGEQSHMLCLRTGYRFKR